MAETRTVKICWLYPELMNLYGDRGNIIAMTQRCAWRGIESKVDHITIGDRVDFTDYDIISMGGGADREQMLLAGDFEGVKGESLRAAIEAGHVFLGVCGALQLMGHYFLTHTGERLPGLGIFDLYTEGTSDRLIGNVVIESTISGTPRSLVGFENHSGKTYLGKGVEPLGNVLKGGGNNGKDGFEGVRYKNAVGTYLHGSVLPKNPWFTDWLIAGALERRYGDGSLAPLDDALEQTAHEAVVKRALGAHTASTQART